MFQTPSLRGRELAFHLRPSTVTLHELSVFPIACFISGCPCVALLKATSSSFATNFHDDDDDDDEGNVCRKFAHCFV